jgi:hypothetical protein
MRKQVVNVTKIIPFTSLVQGKEYFFMSGNVIKRGTLVFCEDCGKPCSANAVTITSFGKSKTALTVADITDDELGYNEDAESCLCSDCY